MDTYETRLYTTVLISGVLLVCLIGFFAASAIHHRRKLLQLQRAYFLEEVQLLEQERSRIARDLHDELGPQLFFAKALLRELAAPTPEDLQNRQRANDHLEKVIQAFGELFINLTPTGLLKKGLEYALRDYFEDVLQASGLPVFFHYDVQSNVDGHIDIHLYRIIREAVHNSLKHSGASQIAVQLQLRRGKLAIRCEDNGKGFAIQEALQTSAGLGLRSIKNRVEMLGGELYYGSEPGKGTYYSFEIPFHESKNKTAAG